MAGVLKINDGTDTVDMLNASGLYLKDKGWRPAVAVEDENGDYLDMVEVITCTWNEDNDDNRATTLKKIKRLDRKARRYWRKRKIKDWVWLEASTHSETDTRYSLIKKIEIPDNLDTRHWAANGPVEVTLVITHRLWWDIAPNGTPTTIVSSTTVYNKQDADGDNYVTALAANVKGDAPALCIVEITDTAPYVNDYLMALKTGAVADLNNFDSHFNAVDEKNYTPGSANTDAPADIEITLTGSTSYNPEWDLPSDLADAEGNYLAFLVGDKDSGTMTAQMYVGTNLSLYPALKGPSATLVNNNITYSAYIQHYLGQFNIPPRRDIPNGLSAQANTITVDVTANAAGDSANIANLFLVPVDEGIFAVRRVSGSTPKFVVNGMLERTYGLDGTGAYSSVGHPNPEGRYIQLKPNTNNRLYFYISRYDGSDYPSEKMGNNPNDSMTVVVKAIARYTSLRGND